ncbi:MAG TPA: hypothetical protein VMU60_03325 [Syntrophobacteria bacterium]|nr:hypothetical protein [Syntrophobacteria bacterium]
MAEIKSTLDLVLERTRHLTLSSVEKEEIELKAALKKVSGYLSRYRDGVLRLEVLLKEMRGLAPEIRQRVRGEMARQTSLALNLSPDTDGLIPAMEALAEPDWTDLLAAVKQCRAEVRKALAAARGSIEGRVLAELDAAGIRGSAVAVKIDGDPQWIALKQELMRPCEARLEALRRALAA